MIEYGVRVVPLVYEATLKLHSIVYRSSLLQVTSTNLQSMPASSVSENPKVVAEYGTSLAAIIDSMIRADEWYTPVVEDEKYVGVLGFEHVIAYALRDEKLQPVLEKPVSEVMTTNPISVKTDEPVHRAWQLMLSKKLSALPVVNEKGRLIGVIAEYDLLRAGYARPRLEARRQFTRGPRVQQLMSTPPVALRPDDMVLEAARLIVSRGIGRVYVVSEEGNLIGVVDREDVVKTLLPRIKSI